MFCGCSEIFPSRRNRRAAAAEQGVQSHRQEARAQLGGAGELDEELGASFQREVRTCVVCFDKEITTVTLPCRHSSVCGDCMQDIRTRTNKCPICRARIASVRDGHYDTEFVDFALLAVETVQDRVKTANAYVYETMYDRVRAFLLLGLLGAVASGVLFVVHEEKLTGIVCGVLALAVGYVP